MVLVDDIQNALRENAATLVQNAMRTVAPAGMRTRYRSANTASRTVPTVLDKRRPSIMAMGA